MRCSRWPQLALFALLASLCVGLVVGDGIVVAVLPPVSALRITLDRNAVLEVVSSLSIPEPAARACPSRGPPLPRSL